jgi:hypothetical protein
VLIHEAQYGATRVHLDGLLLAPIVIHTFKWRRVICGNGDIAFIDEGTSSMGHISGVVSLVFIGMAFLSSCNPQETPKGSVSSPFAILHDK